jgi:hypothetical protein
LNERSEADPLLLSVAGATGAGSTLFEPNALTAALGIAVAGAVIRYWYEKSKYSGLVDSAMDAAVAPPSFAGFWRRAIKDHLLSLASINRTVFRRWKSGLLHARNGSSGFDVAEQRCTELARKCARFSAAISSP